MIGEAVIGMFSMLALIALLGWMTSRCSIMTKLMMARIRLRYVLPLAGLLLVTSVHAAGPSTDPPLPRFNSAMTGREFLAACEGQAGDAVLNRVYQIMCSVYLGGFVDGYALKKAESIIGPGFEVCLPEPGVANGRLKSTVTHWLSAHPGELDESARVAIHIALSQEFPCKVRP